METQEVIIFLLIMASVVGYSLYTNRKKEKQEAPIRKKIEKYREAGQPLMREEEVSLTKEEAAKIRLRQGWMTFLMLLTMEAILVGLACFLIFSIELDQFLILCTLFILSGGWIYWMFRNNAKQKRDVAGGNKTIIRGIITKKYEDGDESTTYYLVIDKTELYVKKAVYKKYRLGDAAEFQVFKPYYNYVLYHTRLEGSGLNDLSESSQA